MTDSRKYGEEGPEDCFERACAAGCRMAGAFGGPCGALRPQRGCRLDVANSREARVVSAYYDNRRGVLASLSPQNGLSTLVTTSKTHGLPHNDPVFIAVQPRKPFQEGELPDYVVRAEGLVVDGPFDLTLLALRHRLDGPAVKKKPKPGGAADPGTRR